MTLNLLKRPDDLSIHCLEFPPDFCFQFGENCAYLALARQIAAGVFRKEVTIVIDEWGIWPSDENWYLFDIVCRSLFGYAHRIQPMRFVDESLAVETILQLSMQSGWGGFCISDENYFRFNHDGHAAVRTIDEEAAENVLKVRGVMSTHQ